jgi:hypothetical protein
VSRGEHLQREQAASPAPAKLQPMVKDQITAKAHPAPKNRIQQLMLRRALPIARVILKMQLWVNTFPNQTANRARPYRKAFSNLPARFTNS